MAGFRKSEMNKIKKAMMEKVMAEKGAIEQMLVDTARGDIDRREARDTDEVGNPTSMKESVFSEIKKGKDKVNVQLGVRYHTYPASHPTTPSYGPDRAPEGPIPAIPTGGGMYGNTVKAAIMVLYGLGGHKGPRNFIYVAFDRFTAKYKLKRK